MAILGGSAHDGLFPLLVEEKSPRKCSRWAFPSACQGKGLFSRPPPVILQACESLGRPQARKASNLDGFKLFSTRIRSSSPPPKLAVLQALPQGLLLMRKCMPTKGVSSKNTLQEQLLLLLKRPVELPFCRPEHRFCQAKFLGDGRQR